MTTEAAEQAPLPLSYGTREAEHHGPHSFFDADVYPAAQFEDTEQQKEAATLGMWAFLATETLLFSGLFAAYVVYRNAYYDGFVAGSNHLNLWFGTINTLVLLTSSLCVALAISEAQLNRPRGIFLYLVITLLLGLTFLVIKYFEWKHDYEIGLVPWLNWDRKWDVAHPSMKMFFTLYFIMTGTHAVHMVIGMTVLSVIALQARRGKFSPEYYTPVEMSGLYWHFVDVVWVFLVPTLYLINRAVAH
jgi:cytochrome c oxidase subunit 3